MKTPMFSERPSRGMLYFHGAMLPILSLGGMAALLFFDYTWRAKVPWLIAPVVVVGMIVWSTTYLAIYAQKASQMRFIQMAAFSVVPAFLLSEKGFFSWGVIKHAIMSERIDFMSFAAPTLSIVMVGFIAWSACVFWKTKSKEGFQAFLFVWFWTSPFSSIALVVGLVLVGLPPMAFPGSGGDACRLHPIRCAVAPFIILAWIMVVAWWAWRLIRKANSKSTQVD